MKLTRQPLVLFEMDEKMRQAQRAAAQGDPQAQARYRRMLQRQGQDAVREHLRGFERAWRSDNSEEARNAYKEELRRFGREIPRELQHAHVPKVTRENAPEFGHGHVFHHVSETNADGSPLRVRVNGRVKTWKRDPDRFEIPVKQGFRGGGVNRIDNSNAHEWMIGHPDNYSEDES